MNVQKLIERLASLSHLFSPYGCYPWPLLDHADDQLRNKQDALACEVKAREDSFIHYQAEEQEHGIPLEAA